MTISTQTFRFSYVSTGGTTYPYTNKILANTDLAVYADDVLQTLTTHYTVTGVGEAAGGNVVFGVAPAAGVVVLITKDGVEFTQETDYVENDSFPAAAHENALDKLTNIAQKIWDYTRRSVKLPITSTLTDLEMPDPEASKVLGWNSTGTALENLSLVGLGGISDEAYNSTTWDGVTSVAPSKNAVRDKIETLAQADITGLKTTDSPVFVTVKCSGLSDNRVPKHLTDASGLTDTTIVVSANNEVTNASQPAFLAFTSGTVTDVTGDGTVYNIAFNSEVFDQNADFATNIFTAPVTGKYQFNVLVTLIQLALAHTSLVLQIVTSNRTYYFNKSNLAVGQDAFMLSALADMDAGDTAYVSIAVSGGTKVVDVFGHATFQLTYFSGFLAC